MPFGGLLTVGLIGAAGGIGSGLIGANAAGNAANAQVKAANNAAALQYQQSQDALNFNKGQYANSQAELAPYLNTGYAGLQQLQYLLGIPSATPQLGSGPVSSGSTAAAPADPFAQYNGKSFSQLVNSGDPLISPNKETTAQWQALGIPFKNITTSDGRQVAVRDNSNSTPASPASSGINIPSSGTSLVNPALGDFGSLLKPFQAPTGLDETNDPGYQARLNLGLQARENSAAAKGGLLSSGTAKALDQFGQDYGSNEYNNVYNRAFNTFETNQSNTFNRLATLAGIGQQGVSTSVNAGQNAAGNVTNIDLTTGGQVGQNINNAGAARASGYVGGANALGGIFSGLGSEASSLFTLSKLLPFLQAGSGPLSVGDMSPSLLKGVTG